ncbi:hypothetical protein ACWGQ5_23590 [Streptomyces sp. NPDC055722]
MPSAAGDFGSGLEPDAATRKHVAAVMQSRNLLPVLWVEPDDVADAMFWLVSDAARMVTCVLLPVDAGKSVL